MTKLTKKPKPAPMKVKKVVNKISHKAKDRVKKLKKTIAKTSTIAKRLSKVSPKKIEKEVKNIIINDKQIEKAVEALIKLIKIDVKKKNENALFDEEQAIFAQVVSVKVPKAIPRTLRIPLPNAPCCLDEVCLIVANLEKTRSKDIDKTKEHYDELLKGIGIKNVNVLPLYQLYTEYDTFEMKRHLVEMYDLFLVDAKISSKVLQILGKKFITKRKQPVPIHMERTNLKREFEGCMKKTSMSIHSRGDNFISQIGHDRMQTKFLVENVECFVEEIQEQFPGGPKNIKSINLKSFNSMAIPIYYNLVNKNNLPSVIETPKRPKKYIAITDELSTYMNSDVTVYPDGTVVKHAKPLKDAKDEDLNEEIPTDDENDEKENSKEENDLDDESKPKKKKKEPLKKEKATTPNGKKGVKVMQQEATKMMSKKQLKENNFSKNKDSSQENVAKSITKNNKKVNKKKREIAPLEITQDVVLKPKNKKKNQVKGDSNMINTNKRNATDGKDKGVDTKKAKIMVKDERLQQVAVQKKSKRKGKKRSG